MSRSGYNNDALSGSRKMKNTVNTEQKTEELTVVMLDSMVVRGSYSKRNPQAIVTAKMTGMLRYRKINAFVKACGYWRTSILVHKICATSNGKLSFMTRNKGCGENNISDNLISVKTHSSSAIGE